MKKLVPAGFLAALLFTDCNQSQKEIRTYEANDTAITELLKQLCIHK